MRRSGQEFAIAIPVAGPVPTRAAMAHRGKPGGLCPRAYRAPVQRTAHPT